MLSRNKKMESSKTIERVILVDDADQVIGDEEKITAHRLALCHRAFSIFIYRDLGQQREWLLQQRHIDKYHCGGLWTNTVCSHPRPNETTLAAANRRLEEEMGFSVKLTYCGKFHYISEFDNGLTENEIDYVYIGPYQDETIHPNPSEVQDYRWLTRSSLEQEIQLQPQQFTPWFTSVLTMIS